MNMRRTIISLCCVIFFQQLCAQIDTGTNQRIKTNWWNSKPVRIASGPVAFFGASALSWPERQEVRKLRNRFIPSFHHKYDNYMQYLPILTVIGLNSAGVKGKHTPKRAVVSYGFSAVIMALVVNGIKYSTNVERPDGSTRNSFPSGHTANSFMNASVMHKEYGQYRNPLYSVGAYTAATATAIGRQLNNRHWVSDVLAGAGIGILATELGYILADKVFKEKGNNLPLKYNPYPVNRAPSFIEMRIGVARLFDPGSPFASNELTIKSGFNLGLEGAYFFSKNIGIGGEFAFSSFPIKSNNLTLDPAYSEFSTGIYTQPMGIRYLTAGPYFSLPLPQNWFITGKLNAGTSAGAEGTVNLELMDEYKDVFQSSELKVLRYKPQAAFAWSVGAGIQKRVGRNTAVKFYTTFFDSKNRFKVDVVESIDKLTGKYSYSELSEDNINFRHLMFGMALTAFLW